MSPETEIRALKQILQRERLARKEAEAILETKASELLKANHALLALNKNLEETVRLRTQEVEAIARFAQENPDPVIRISLEGHVLHQNPTAEALLTGFLYRDRLFNPAAFWKHIIGEIDYKASHWNFEAGCGSRLFSFTCALHVSEEYINIYGCDVTEQRKALRALEESEQKWQFVLKAAGDGIWEYDLQTKEITFSRNYKELLGFDKETFLNHERLWRSRIHPDDIYLIDRIIADYEAGKIRQHATQYRIRKRSGNYIWILDRGVLMTAPGDDRPLKIIGVHTNIDHQKRLELNFKSTANRLSTLVAGLHIGIMMEDENGEVLVTNKMMCDIFGVSYEEQKFRKDNLATLALKLEDGFYGPEHFVESLHEVAAARTPVIGEKWEMADGRFIRRSFIPVYSNENNFQGNLWVIEDITDQINNERALKQQRRFYEQILNNIPADVAVFDIEQQYLFVNPIGLKNELLRKNLFGNSTAAHSDHLQSLHAAFEERKRKFAELLQTKKLLSWEEELLRPDGSKEYSLRNLYPVLNAEGVVDMVIGYGLNITERKEIEQKIQLSEKKYRDLINFSYALIITHDPSGRILSANPSVCRTLGYTYPELIGKHLTDFMLPADAGKVQEDYLQRITSENLAEGVFRVVSKSGKIIYLLYKNYLFLEEGQNAYIIGFAQDITERIMAEKELRLAKKATEEAAIAKERFLADMSHEIRTPMNGILGLASLLEQSRLDDVQREQLQLLKESANNLLIIVNDVLDLEKIVSGKMELEKIPFAVLEKVRSSIASFRFKIEEKGLAIRHHNEVPEDLVVLGDPYRLGQILNNLLSNALKFTTEGSITVTTRLLRKSGEQALIEYTVSDTGIGIPASKLKQIFDPYMQARPEISRKYGGTGLGLAISKNLVAMQQGKIKVNSQEGEGSLFTFSIPYQLAKAIPKATTIVPRQESEFLCGKKILVAEDVQINQYLIRNFLSGSQCTLQFADNGKKAVDEVMKEEYDLVLMDIQMPEMDGVAATKCIRQLPDEQKAAIPIIALTANALKGANEKYISAGMDDYLSKPFTKEALFETMERTLKRQRQSSAAIAAGQAIE